MRDENNHDLIFENIVIVLKCHLKKMKNQERNDFANVIIKIKAINATRIQMLPL